MKIQKKFKESSKGSEDALGWHIKLLTLIWYKLHKKIFIE